jgi:VanZ family protein
MKASTFNSFILKKHVRFGLAFLYLLVTLWLFTLPGSAFPDNDWFDTLQVDKWVHATLFFGLCGLFMYPILSFDKSSYSKIKIFIVISSLAIGYGISIEFIQRYYIPNRSFDIWDIVADTIGSILAFIWFKRKLT